MGDPTLLYTFGGALAVLAGAVIVVILSHARLAIKMLAILPEVVAVAGMLAIMRLPYVDHRILINSGLLILAAFAAVVSFLMIRKFRN